MRQLSPSLTYAMPDIHGRFDLLLAGLAKISAHADGRAATLVMLGDYVDRGPDSCRVIDHLTTWQSSDLRLVTLKGNHEEMMWQTCTELPDPARWIANGGDRTLISYGQSPNEPLNLLVVPRAHLDWIAKLPLLHVDRYRVYVHAAVDPTRSLDRQDPRTLLWKRYREAYDAPFENRHIVHGHQARVSGPIAMKHRTNLDTMAWKTGRLVVGVFEDIKPGGAREFLEVLGPVG
jgi:serine/threonine protein phosphatase 1